MNGKHSYQVGDWKSKYWLYVRESNSTLWFVERSFTDLDEAWKAMERWRSVGDVRLDEDITRTIATLTWKMDA